MFPTEALLAYIGPDMLLPLTSIVAAVVAALAMFWRTTTAWVASVFHRIIGTNSPPPVPDDED